MTAQRLGHATLVDGPHLAVALDALGAALRQPTPGPRKALLRELQAAMVEAWRDPQASAHAYADTLRPQRKPDSLCTPEQIAELVGRSPSQVRNVCRQGYFDGARKIGRQWLVPKDEAVQHFTAQDAKEYREI